MKLAEEDMRKSESIGLVVALIVLIVVFGSVVAAVLPLLMGLFAIGVSLGLVALVGQIWHFNMFVENMITMIGLAVGIDYSLFIVSRYREERGTGLDKLDAITHTGATASRAVLFSGLTVMVAMGGMLLTGDPSFASMGIATMMVVAIAMLGSLTVLPALLSKLGDKVDRLHVPFVGRLRRDDGQGRIWGAIVDRVLKRPALSVAVAGGLLVALAVPALELHTAQPGPESFPQELPVMQTYNRLQNAFPGKEIPANVVVKADDVTAPEVQAAIGELRKRAVATGRMHEPITVDVNDAGTVASIAIPMDGKGTDDASNAALAALRGEVVPETVGALGGVETAVTGMAASSKDGNDQLKSSAPLVFGFVLVFAFVLMLAAFRSVAIAVKAIVLNLLSVAAAYGVLVAVFQHGVGKNLLGFESTSGIVPFLPVFLFVILFGLSMDYHVFILSRIRELYDRGATTDEAISQGIKGTAGVVTSAAIVMVGVFAIFGTLSMIVFKQFGVGLAAAVLIDATIVRAVLLPATMKLLGEWNWWFPRRLEWLPSLGHERKPESPALESA
jgi:RND superfamily putative drug exporter